MKGNNTKTKRERWIAACLAAVLLASVLFPAMAFAAEAEDGTIHIQSQEDLRVLAENCRLDTWSQGKTVILDNDIALDEDAQDFLPIPTFGGIFEGGGYTISGFSLTGEDSNAGLFDTLQESAVVSHLTVVGQVTPGGSSDTIGGIAGTNYGKLVDCSFEGAVKGKDSVGGLVGINEATGQLISCRYQGTVTGEHYVGGIAGQNTGSLIQCRNDGEINTTAVEVSADLSDLSLLGTTESVPAGTDIGGIVGFSSGVIQSCTNTGNVGYEHMSYNVGGIAGRQSGYLGSCRNTGTVQGRKDVGGIAGQLEPKVTLRYNEDLLDKLWTKLDTLQSLTDQATANVQNSSHILAGNFNDLSINISDAKNAASGLSDALTNWGNENVEEINDASARLSWVISQTEPVLNSVSEAISHLQTVSELLLQAAGKVNTADEMGAAAAAELEQASQDVQAVFRYARSSTEHMATALKLAQNMLIGDKNEETIRAILTELDAAVTGARSAKTSLSSALSHANTARGYLEVMGDTGAGALEDVNTATEPLALALASMDQAVDKMSEIIQTLTDQPAISFTPVDSSVTSQGDALDSALSQMIASASSMNSNLTSASDTLLEDIRAINSQLGAITDLLQEEAADAKEKDAADPFEDISDTASGDPAAGKVMNAVNSGQVQGDVNVAGIVGSMSVEYDFDPEDDLTEDGTRSLDFQYRTLAVVTGCINEGSVMAKKDYAGGIVGRMDLGAIKACESYGQVEITSGDYVGGIAGICRATIRNCFVKCFLSGGDYVGGVSGASKDNTVISGCYALVEITDGGRYTGAVCGTESGEFSENYYVSDTLAGLGRISYTGKAEPLSFDALSQVSGIPGRMTQFTLRFLVEDEEIKSYDFSYGASFGPEVFPEIPVKDGYYASWDTQDLTDLHFDKTVTAEYVRYVLTLPSDTSRFSGRPVFLMDGNFDNEAALTVTQAEEMDLVNGKSAIEQWHLSCSDPSQESYTVRYLSPDETTNGYTVFVRDKNGWQKASCSEFGSYLVFTVATPEVDVAVVPTTSGWLPCIIVGAVIVLLLILLIALHKHRRTKKQNVPVPAQTADETAPEGKSAEKPGKKRKVLLLLLLIFLLIIAAVCALVGKKLGTAADACQSLQELAAQQESAMTLSMSIQLDDTLTNTEMDITRTQVEGHTVNCIQSNGVSLYYTDSAVIMENGRAFKISELYPDYSVLPAQAAELFEAFSFSTSHSDGNVTCHLTAEGDNAGRLLKVLLPDQADNLSDTQKLTVELTYSENEVLSLCFSSQGTLMDAEKTAYTLTAELKPKNMDSGFTVPSAVEETVCSGNAEGEASISEDLFRLLSAWTTMSQEDSFSADVQLGVECGPISLNESIKYGQSLAEGSPISFVRKDDLTVYFAEETFCDQNGVLLTQQGNALVDRARLLEVLKQICLNGQFACTDTGNSTWLYTLTLDESSMKTIAYAAAPEMESLPVTLASGSVQIIVNGTTIKEIECSCTGGLDALEEVAPVTVSVKMVFAHNSEFEVPSVVKNQLMEERGKDNGE